MFSNKRRSEALQVVAPVEERPKPRRVNTDEALQAVVVSTDALETAINKSRLVQKFAARLRDQAAIACLDLEEVK